MVKEDLFELKRELIEQEDIFKFRLLQKIIWFILLENHERENIRMQF